MQVAAKIVYSNKLLLNIESGSEAVLGLNLVEKYSNGFKIPFGGFKFCFRNRLLFDIGVTPNF
jgi:hypothetical protein